MSSLPDVDLSGTAAADVSADEAPGVHVSEDAPTIEVTPVPMAKSPHPGSPESDLGDLPEGDLDGDRVTATERGLEVVRHWAAQATDGARQVTLTPGGVLTAKPPSFAEYRAYVRSRAWVPDGYEKGWLIWLPLAYYNTLGNAGVLTGYAIAWLTGRLLHFATAVAVVILTAALIFIFN